MISDWQLFTPGPKDRTANTSGLTAGARSQPPPSRRGYSWRCQVNRRTCVFPLCPHQNKSNKKTTRRNPKDWALAGNGRHVWLIGHKIHSCMARFRLGVHFLLCRKISGRLLKNFDNRLYEHNQQSVSWKIQNHSLCRNFHYHASGLTTGLHALHQFILGYAGMQKYQNNLPTHHWDRAKYISPLN